MTTDDDDDRMPSAATGNTKNEANESMESDAVVGVVTPSSSSSWSTLQAMRLSYADAFLERCEKIDPKDFDLPVGRTYICPWMPPSEELYSEEAKDILQCNYCDKRVYSSPGHWGTSEMIQHFENGCSKYTHKKVQIEQEIKQLEDLLKKSKGEVDQLNQVIDDLRAKKQDALKKVEALESNEDKFVSHNQFVEEFQKHVTAIKKTNDEICTRFDSLRSLSQPYIAMCEKYCALSQALMDMKENRWTIVDQQKDAEPIISGIDRLEYWASRCSTNDMEYFDGEIMRRPDARCSLDLITQHEGKSLDFGSQVFRASLLPSNENTFPGYSACAMQATWEPYRDINYDKSSEHFRLGLTYAKDAVWAYEQWEEDQERYYPFMPSFAVPLGGVNKAMGRNSSLATLRQHGGPNSDVWTYERADIGPIIEPVLNDIASVTNDCPLPRYQMIIDPNQFVRARKSDGKNLWVPCEFDVNSDGSKVSLIGGDRAHWMKSSVIDAVASPVLTAALPLLAKLTKPHMLIEGQRLQVVVKAQSITVPKKQPGDDPPEYIGLWHVDGEHEPVAAVILYYYDVDDALVGGNMEFLDRRPITLLGYGDNSADSEIDKYALRRGLRPDGSEPPQLPNCSVPIRSGTLLVFSNYQMAHRVLRMVNTSTDRHASRKFVALFVMDPAAKRLVPSAAHLAKSYLFKRALTGKCMNFPPDASSESMPETAAELVMEFLGILPSLLQRRATRNELLRSQLIPKQTLGRSNEMVCSTGNGCLTMIGWIDSLLMDYRHRADARSDYHDEKFKKAENRINALNYPPKDVGRGLSETLSIPSDDLDEMALFCDTASIRKEQLNADFDKKLLESKP